MRDHQASQFDVPAWDALALMRTCEVGRLCVIDHGTPLALPVNFKVDAQGSSVRIVVPTSPTGLLGSAEDPVTG